MTTWSTALPQGGLGLPVHLVAAEEPIGAVPAQDHPDTAAVDPGEQQPGDDGVDDIAVFGELAQPDRLADIRPAYVARRQLDDLVIDAEITEFMAWYLTRRVVPVISNLRSHVERVAEVELQRVSGLLSGLDDR